MGRQVLIGNIQRFCVSDGDGIRTTVFLKGCNVHCPWCSNPENQSYSVQYFNDNGNRIEYGKYMTNEEILKVILRDEAYYKGGGGVTYSGGEPLLSLDSVEGVLSELKKRGISQWVETSLFAPTEKLEYSMRYLDNFIVDMKNIVLKQCRTYIGGDSELYLKNFRLVADRYNKMIVRIPVIEPYTFNEENIESIISFLNEYPDIRIEIFRVHNMGMEKYKKLNISYSPFEEISDDKFALLYERIRQHHDAVEVLKI